MPNQKLIDARAALTTAEATQATARDAYILESLVDSPASFQSLKLTHEVSPSEAARILVAEVKRLREAYEP